MSDDDWNEWLLAIRAETAARVNAAIDARRERERPKRKPKYRHSPEIRAELRAQRMAEERSLDDGRSPLRTARLAADLTQRELAAKCVMSRRQVQLFEADREAIVKTRRPYLLARLAIALKADKAELFPEMFP